MPKEAAKIKKATIRVARRLHHRIMQLN
jgi:hypothetical protein